MGRIIVKHPCEILMVGGVYIFDIFDCKWRPVHMLVKTSSEITVHQVAFLEGL